MFEKLALIGIGLIGSSIARAARLKGLARTIAISTRSAETLDEARGLGLGDVYTLDPIEAVAGADLVILCIPVQSYGGVMEKIGPYLAPGAILSDVGSVKQHVIKAMAPFVPKGVSLIPGHPIAGTEHSGPASGFPELFINRWCVLTPARDVDPAAVEKLTAFWSALGSNVEIMDAAHHDMVLAITSHIPHLVAYNIVGTVADLEQDTQSEVIKFSASGFRDFTRIAASDPVMWRDVFLTNRDAVLEMLGRFLEDLAKLQRMVRVGDGPGLEELFTRTRKIRRSIITAGQETAAADFGRPHGEAKTLEGPSGTLELTGAPAPQLDVNVEVSQPVREHGGGDDA
ncbi:MAG: prephenate/arogenate dehydrogenase family protein [Devosia nanyangense]|uniref:prephenate dehydrogenase n=1 Tax=Devosia nanyangense TaxID=1228055 RepID=A0A933L601_9HYPH|nr:prephenate/arogenate dehydrogenase family protein [Devosia nanyangense]